MICYQELYVSDADGNRGMYIINAELEPSDAEEIRNQIECMFDPDKQLYTIFIYCDLYDTEHEFEVNINDYFTPTEIKDMR